MAYRKYELKDASFEYDFDRDGGAISFIPLALILPAQVGFTSVAVKVIDPFTSGGGGFATIEVGANGNQITNGFGATTLIQDLFAPLTILSTQVFSTQEEYGITITNDPITAGIGVFVFQYYEIVEQA